MLTVDYQRLDLKPGQRVLDLGAGFGRHAFEAFRRGARTVAVDLAHPELVACTRTFAAMTDAGEQQPTSRAGAVQASALALPFPDGAFDVVIASEVLEHIQADTEVLAELARVLSPGGQLAVTVPAWLCETVCWKLSRDYHAPAAAGGHLRIYTADVLRNRLRMAGFEPVGTGRAHGLHAPYWWLRCAVGVTNERHPLVAAYHRLLVWDITAHRRPTRWADQVLSRLVPKSLVLYAVRGQGVGTDVAG
ncbi:MAG: class I SAM-dependent methyltransferase [Acidimicrobiales bacterium]